MLTLARAIAMPVVRAQKWPAFVAFLFACLVLGQLAAKANAESNPRVLVGQAAVGHLVI